MLVHACVQHVFSGHSPHPPTPRPTSRARNPHAYHTASTASPLSALRCSQPETLGHHAVLECLTSTPGAMGMVGTGTDDVVNPATPPTLSKRSTRQADNIVRLFEVL